MKYTYFFTSKFLALLVITFFLNDVSVKAQTYNPCFLKTGAYTTNTGNWCFKKADFNNDGKMDIATSGSIGGGNTGALLVFLGNGFNGFSSSPNYTHNITTGINFCTSDFNSDGNQDIAILNSTNTLRILIGNGNGTFNFLTTFLTPSCSAICAADFNNDTKPDIAVACGNGSVSILNNTGAGTFALSAFQATTSVSSFFNFYDIITDDYNNDGKKDLVVFSTNGTSSILLGNGNCTFANSPGYYNTNARNFISFDINNDGNKDMLASNYAGGINLFFGDGNGSFASSSLIPASQVSSNVLPLDVNNDGFLDLCYSNYSQMVFLLGTASGTFTNTITFYTGDANERIIDVDFDSNGILDFVTAENNSFSILLNQKPYITGGPTVCAGESVTLSAYLASGNPSCYWLGTSSFFNSITVSPSVNTTYTASASSFNCPNNYSTITLTVIPPPVISVSAPSSTVCAGNSIVLNASGVVSYTWGQGVNTSSISVSPNVNTVYTVLGTGSNNCSSSASIAVNVAACIGLADKGNPLLQSIKLYPNPASTNLFVSLKDINVSINSPIEMEVFNNIGQSQLKTVSFDTDNAIDLQGLSSGIYFLKVSQGKTQQACIKFSKL